MIALNIQLHQYFFSISAPECNDNSSRLDIFNDFFQIVIAFTIIHYISIEI